MWPYLELGLLLLLFFLWVRQPDLWLLSESDQPQPLRSKRGVIQFFYFIGVPYLLVILGWLNPRFLGLKGLEYFNFVEWGSDLFALQLQQAITLMLLNWLLDSRILVLVSLAALVLLIGLGWGLARQGVNLSLANRPILTTLYEALHWALYRGLAWSATNDLYVGVVLGSSLVIAEWTVAYRLQKSWPTYRQQFLLNSIILVLTAMIFFYTPNLWLLFPLHLVMVAVMKAALVRVAGAEAGRTPL
jgi:hypothetical protein